MPTGPSRRPPPALARAGRPARDSWHADRELRVARRQLRRGDAVPDPDRRADGLADGHRGLLDLPVGFALARLAAVDIFGIDLGHFQSLTSSLNLQIATLFMLQQNVSTSNAGTTLNPFIRCFNHILEIGIGNDSFRSS